MEVQKPNDILKTARKAKGITQEELADRIDVSHRMYQRYEKGNFPKYKTDKIKSIDEILGTKLYELIYEQNVPRETKQNVVSNKPKTYTTNIPDQLIIENQIEILAYQKVILSSIAEMRAPVLKLPARKLEDILIKMVDDERPKIANEMKRRY